MLSAEPRHRCHESVDRLLRVAILSSQERDPVCGSYLVRHSMINLEAQTLRPSPMKHYRKIMEYLLKAVGIFGSKAEIFQKAKLIVVAKPNIWGQYILPCKDNL